MHCDTPDAIQVIDKPLLSLFLRLQLRVVLADECPDLRRAGEDAEPLFFVESDGSGSASRITSTASGPSCAHQLAGARAAAFCSPGPTNRMLS